MNLIFNELIYILPEIILIIGSLILALTAAYKGKEFINMQVKIAYLTVFFAFAVQIYLFNFEVIILNNSLEINNFTSYIKFLILIGIFVILCMTPNFYRNSEDDYIAEFPVLILLATAGMMFAVSSNHLLSLYMSVELQALAFYILASLNRDHIHSSEAGVKYFILGSIASAILLFGISYIYGFTGTGYFSAIGSELIYKDNINIMLLVGVILFIIGILFKISAVPFHMWTPDVYQGAPTIVTALFASVPKIALIAVFVRVLNIPFTSIIEELRQILIFVSVASMIIGALGAMIQKNIKRFLAFSSISHVGFILVGLVSASLAGISGILIYLTIYLFLILGIFAVIISLKTKDENYDINIFAGLAKTKPLWAFTIAVLMFSSAGMPPFAGFFGKFYVFSAAIKEELYIFAVIGILASILSAYYYLKIVKIMYFDNSKYEVTNYANFSVQVFIVISVVFNLFFFLKLPALVDISEKVAASLM